MASLAGLSVPPAAAAQPPDPLAGDRVVAVWNEATLEAIRDGLGMGTMDAIRSAGGSGCELSRHWGRMQVLAKAGFVPVETMND